MTPLMSKLHSWMPLLSDGNRVIRGEWPGEKPRLACRVTISLDCVVPALSEEQKVATDMLVRRDFHLVLIDLPQTLRMASLLQRLQPCFKAVLQRMQGGN